MSITGAAVPAPPKAARSIGKWSQHLGCGDLPAAFKIDSFQLASQQLTALNCRKSILRTWQSEHDSWPLSSALRPPGICYVLPASCTRSLLAGVWGKAGWDDGHQSPRGHQSDAFLSRVGNSHCVNVIINCRAWDRWAPWGWPGQPQLLCSGLGLHNTSCEFWGTICKHWDNFQCSFLSPTPKAVLLLSQSCCMMQSRMTGLSQSKGSQFLFQAGTLLHNGQWCREQEKEKSQEESDPFLGHPVSGQSNLGTSWAGSWNQNTSLYSASPGGHTLLPSSFLPLHYQASPMLVAFLPAPELLSVLQQWQEPSQTSQKELHLAVC